MGGWKMLSDAKTYVVTTCEFKHFTIFLQPAITTPMAPISVVNDV